VLSFSQVVGFRTPPTPHPQASVALGEGHTRWRERGWESPNSDEGTYTVVLFINTYFVYTSIGYLCLHTVRRFYRGQFVSVAAEWVSRWQLSNIGQPTDAEGCREPTKHGVLPCLAEGGGWGVMICIVMGGPYQLPSHRSCPAASFWQFQLLLLLLVYQ
jgi:hypothetical protein